MSIAIMIGMFHVTRLLFMRTSPSLPLHFEAASSTFSSRVAGIVMYGVSCFMNSLSAMFGARCLPFEACLELLCVLLGNVGLH